MSDKKRNDKVFEPELLLVVFKLGEEEYAIKIEQVKEVTITPEITKMPKTPRFIKGVANIRGDIITIIDLNEKFNITKPEKIKASTVTYTLVVEMDDFPVGLIVSEVPITQAIPISKIDSSASIIRKRSINEDYIYGIGKTEDGRLIIILNVVNLLTMEEMELLRKE